MRSSSSPFGFCPAQELSVTTVGATHQPKFRRTFKRTAARAE